MTEFTGVAISLESQREGLARELRRVRLDGSVEIMVVERDAEDGIRGCFRSHQRALRIGLERDPTRPILVLEDDVVFAKRPPLDVHLGLVHALSALRAAAADVVALGGMATTPLRRVHPPHVYATVFQTTHAYVMSPDAARRVVEWPFVRHHRVMRFGDHYDHALSAGLRQALVVPTVAFQAARRDELTTTNAGDWAYVTLVALRDLVSQRAVQIFLEWAMWIAGLVRLRR